MNGYGSHCSATHVTLIEIQTTTSAVWNTRNRAVPSKRAIDSANTPNASESYQRPRRRVARGALEVLAPLHHGVAPRAVALVDRTGSAPR